MITRELLTSKTLCSRLFTQICNKRCLNSNSQRPRPEGQHYRLWAMPGDMIYKKDILARQYQIRWHPGLNAGIDELKNIYALCDGIMVITEEGYKPDWEHPLVKKCFMSGEEKRAPVYARYIHVIPRKKISEFKLIDVV